MTKKERKQYEETLRYYNSIHDYDYDKDDDKEEEFYDWGQDTYDDSFLSNDWNFGTDYEDF